MMVINEMTKDLIEGLDFECFFEGKLIVCVGNQSPLAKKGFITPKELLEQQIVIYEDDNITDFVNDFSQKVGKLNVLFESNNSDAIRNAVINNEAVTIGHNFSFMQDPYLQLNKMKLLNIFDYDLPVAKLGWLRTKENTISESSNKFISEFTL